MKVFRAVLAVLAVILWALSAPLAMASGECMAMGAGCEGPCGASSCAATGLMAKSIVLVETGAPTDPVTGFPSVSLALPEPPPRSTLLFA
jgi:hypothetical protein